MKRILFSHFFNEQMLLPAWLSHHRRLFDHGVLIDYASTDSSREIIRQFCPTWEIRTSRNVWFDARAVDREIMDAEAEFENAWKITLNTTEFLVCSDLESFCRFMGKYRTDVRGVWAADFTMVDAPSPFLNFRAGYHSAGNRSRILHREKHGQYATGRHESKIVRRVLDDELFICWFGWGPWPAVIERKLQIQTRIPESDKRLGLGAQHLATRAQLEDGYARELSISTDLWTEFPAYRDACRRMGCALES